MLSTAWYLQNWAGIAWISCPETANSNRKGENSKRQHWTIFTVHRRTDMEMKMSDLDEALKHAMSLDVHDRAALAESLLASLEELPEEEAERLWAEEAQRRLDTYRSDRALAIRAEEVHEKAERLFR